MQLTKEEKLVRKAISDIYPQLVINSRNVCGAAYDKHGHDLLAMSIEMYLEKPIEYQLKVINDKKLVNFLTYIMNFQLKHATTRFYHHYRKHNEKQRDWLDNYDYVDLKSELNNQFKHAYEDSDDDLMLCIKHKMELLNPYQSMLLKEYIINGNTYDEISERYDIPYFHLQKDLKDVLQQLKDTCQHLR